MPMQRLVSVSGGKDSTAMYLLAIEHGRPFRAIFADTGFEAPVTREYLYALPEKTGGPPIETVKADLTEDVLRKRENLPRKWAEAGVPGPRIAQALSVLWPTGHPFVDLCLSRGGFPSAGRRYCTDQLKIKPIAEKVYAPILDAGDWVLSWQGIRAQESKARAGAPQREEMFVYGCDYHVFRPLLHWSVSDVMEMHARHGLKPNPLYTKGFSRVGCWPCVMTNKGGLRALALYDPQAIEVLDKWEALINQATRSGAATFFPGRDVSPVRPIHHTTHGIRQKVDWAKTQRGGKKYELFLEQESEPGSEWGKSCATYGVCE